ncbi:MAG: hypothetical protein IIA14_08970 [SAR324 cluster bacterium]|nr:hypothetical protein [SAR324 cluster bacterium]
MEQKTSQKSFRDLDDLEMEALVLFAGRPSVLEAFYDLTDHKTLNLRYNPLQEPIQWEGKEKPTDEEIRRLAAVQTLIEDGYVMAVDDNGPGDFSGLVSDKAEAVRKALDQFPKNLKEMIKEEVAKSAR